MVTFTYSLGTVAGYVDGIQKSMAYDTFPKGLTLPDSQYGLNIGADSNGGSNAKGILDDVKLYKQALTASQVSQLYSQTKH